ALPSTTASAPSSRSTASTGRSSAARPRSRSRSAIAAAIPLVAPCLLAYVTSTVMLQPPSALGGTRPPDHRAISSSRLGMGAWDPRSPGPLPNGPVGERTGSCRPACEGEGGEPRDDGEQHGQAARPAHQFVARDRPRIPDARPHRLRAGHTSTMRMDRHRRRRWRVVLVPAGAAFALVVLASVGRPPHGLLPARRAAARAAEFPPPPSRGATVAHRPALPLARWHDVRLVLPVSHPVCVCYQEASYHDALPLHPLGHLVRDENLTKFRPRTAPTHGPAYVIMASRGRPTPATSAVDVVTRPGQPFLAPADGVVTKVKAYRLYGRYADVEVVIRPSADPRYRVVMIHLAHVSVRPGERVIAGLTRLGVARVFP